MTPFSLSNVVALAALLYGFAGPLTAAAQDASSAATFDPSAYVALVENAYAGRSAPDGERWYERVVAEDEAIERALELLIERGDIHQALRMAGAMGYFWDHQGRSTEGLVWLRRVLDLAGPETRTPEKALVLYRMGTLAFRQSKEAEAALRTGQALALYEELGDDGGQALVHAGIARLALRKQDHETVRRHADQSIALSRRLGDRGGEALALHMVAESARMQGKLDEAEQLYETSLGVNRELGNMGMVAIELHNLGYVALRRGDAERARALFSESMSLDSQEIHALYCLAGLAAVAAYEGDAERSITLYAALQRLFAATDVVLDPADQMELDRFYEMALGQADETAKARAVEAGEALQLTEALDLARSPD